MNKTMTYVKPLVIATAGLVLAGGAFAAEWSVVPETSSVGFTGSQQGTRFNGRFQTFSAKIDFEPGSPAAGSIVGTVQLDSVNTRDHDRDASLLDKDWFDVAQFPEAKFESKAIAATADGFEATGDLTLKGVTKPSTLKFTFVPSETSGQTGSAQFAGQLVVNRFDFNVGEGWNDTSWVGENVTVDIKLDLKR